MEDEQVKLDSLLEFAELRFSALHNKAAAAAHMPRLEALVREHRMAPAYIALCKDLGKTPDSALVAEIEATNAAKLKEIDEKIADAEENLGETEVREAYQARALFYHSIGAKEEAIQAYRVLYDKTVALALRFDIVFSLIRIGLAFSDNDLITAQIAKGHRLVDEGGDWERRNRLKVYEGVQNLRSRKFKEASKLFLESVATFTSTELIEFRRFVTYVVLSAAVSVDRPTLKSKVIDSPEVLQVIGEVPYLSQFLNSLYDCSYMRFFEALVRISDHMAQDMFLYTHVAFFSREMRLRGYTQYLESYKSVTLKSMSVAFGVSEEYLDRDLARLIAAGRIAAKIDKVAGTVETNRPDTKNALYQQAIKQGDNLLNRVQRLSRVIDI